MTLTGFLFGITSQLPSEMFPQANIFLRSYILPSMSSQLLTELSPPAKGLPTSLPLTGFLPSKNTSGAGEG